MVKFNMSSYNKIINEKGKGGDQACLRLQWKMLSMQMKR